MTTRIIPPGLEDITGYVAADGDILKSIEGGQQITNCSFAAYSAQNVFLGRKSQIRTDIAAPLILDLNQNGLATTTPSTLSDFRTGAQAFHFTPGGPGAIIRRVKHGGTSPLAAVGASGRIYRWEGMSGNGSIAAGVRLDELVLDGETLRVQYNSNAMTDLRLISGSLVSDRGFSGTCEVLSGASALFKRTDSSQTLPTGVTLRVMGGRVDWQMGNITTLWLLDGDMDISQAPKDLAITTLYISSRMKRTKAAKLLSQHAAVTRPSTVGTDLFVYGDETDDLNV